MKKVSKLFALALMAIGFNFQIANAQNSKPMFTFTKIVDASADDVWEVLRQMDDIDQYSSLIAKVSWTGDHNVGGQRVCHSPDGKGYFKEGIVKFDDQNRTYSYAVLEGVPVKGMVNTFKVVDMGYRKAMIVWTSGYEQFLKNPQMDETQFKGFIDQSVNEMIDNVAKTASRKS